MLRISIVAAASLQLQFQLFYKKTKSNSINILVNTQSSLLFGLSNSIIILVNAQSSLLFHPYFFRPYSSYSNDEFDNDESKATNLSNIGLDLT